MSLPARFAVLVLGLVPIATAQSPPSDPAPAAVQAWIRFDDAEQEYRGTRYRFLGDHDLELTIAVRPSPDHALDLRWGAKNDERSASLTVNGKPLQVRGGGHDGFQWLRVPLPAGLTGSQYTIVVRRGETSKPAFLAEVRLVSPGAGESPDLTARSSKVALKLVGPSLVEAFPEMRPFWDRRPEPLLPSGPASLDDFDEAEINGRQAAEGLYRCRRFVDGWLQHADPKSGLIPRNLGQDRDIWNGRDAGADNYPFMVLTCALTDRAMFAGRMRDMLRAETRLTSRVDRLPEVFRFSTQSFAHEKPNLDAIIFDGAEYVKDGLLPLTEWLGESPWSERMIGIIDDIWKHAPIDTPQGKIPTLNFEVNGDLLQACSRLYWFTGDRKYLDWAIRLGDYYLLGDHHPTRDLPELSMSDHGCEVVNGLSELYVAVSHAAPEKKKAYQAPLRELYDAILAHARNEHGLLYHTFSARAATHAGRLVDTWGYNYDGIYTAYLIDGVEAYRDAVRHALGNLKPHYTGHNWGGADGYADSLEGAINLLNREPMPSAAEWVDREIRTMWAIQKPDGVIEGWHGDGNFARTTIMYSLWKSQGVTAEPWREDLVLGAVRRGDTLHLFLSAEKPWNGALRFDRPRHKLNLHLPLDYPRINQFPEWFTVEAQRDYGIDGDPGGPRQATGEELARGMPVELQPGEPLRWRVEMRKPQ